MDKEYILFPGRETTPRFFGYPDRSLDTNQLRHTSSSIR
jgi:hypothetical protein